METIRNAATAAANLVGLGGTEENREGETGHIAGGEAPQNVATGTSQSGTEPLSGKLGRGEAGEPYDAGNVDGASGLGSSSLQNPSSDYTSQSTSSRSTGSGLGSGLTGGSGLTSSSGNSGLTGSGLGSNTTSSYNNSSSEPLSEKVRETFGVGGGNKQGTGLGGREDGPGYGTASNRDRDSSLGSAIGHGSNPDKYAYDSQTAPGLGGHRIGDDFTSSNTRNEGRDSLPSNLGSDVAAGRSGSGSGGLTGRSDNDNYSSGTGESLTQKAKGYLPGGNPNAGLTGRSNNDSYSSGTGESLTQKAKDYLPGTSNQSSSGGLTGRSNNDTYSSGTGESLTQKAKDYLPGTGSQSNTQQDSALAGAREVISGSGRNDGYNSSSTYGSSNTSSLPVRSQDSSLTGDRGFTGSSSTGSGLTGGSSGLTSGLTGSSTTGSHSHGISGETFDQEREGYVPHGGHPIGEAAHNTEDGKQTWLDYRNDPNLPVARANPADE